MLRFAQKFLCVSIFVSILVSSAGRLAGTPDMASSQPAIQHPASSQPAIQIIPVASGLSGLAHMTSAHDGSNRLFIVQLDGKIETLPPGAPAPLPTPFLDLNAIGVEGRLLALFGLAFHPEYRTNGRFFVNYTRIQDNATVISEFQVSAGDPNLAQTAERVLLTIPKPFDLLNGGWIDFGPDGYLYFSVGDGSLGRDDNN